MTAKEEICRNCLRGKSKIIIKKMEDFEKKVSIKESMEIEEEEGSSSSKNKEILHLLRKFLDVQQRRAQAYSKLKTGFSEYMNSGGELAYQQLCSEITIEFNDCSKQVLEMESLFLNPDYCRVDLAQLLRAVQTQEKQKLHLRPRKRLAFQGGAFAEQQFKEDIYYMMIMAMYVMLSHWIHSPVAVLKEETNSLVMLSLEEHCNGWSTNFNDGNLQLQAKSQKYGKVSQFLDT